MNVIAVRQGDKFGPEYTRMLKAMVNEHLHVPLLILGDGDDAHLKLSGQYHGWHAKLELFRPDLEPLRPFLYFDLDTYLLGDCSALTLFEPKRLMLIRDFTRPNKQGNSGVMIIPKFADVIWERRCTDVADGDYLARHCKEYIQDVYPGMVSSYKLHNRNQWAGGPVVCFHGQPKPHETTGWAKEVWDRYSR